MLWCSRSVAGRGLRPLGGVIALSLPFCLPARALQCRSLERVCGCGREGSRLAAAGGGAGPRVGAADDDPRLVP